MKRHDERNDVDAEATRDASPEAENAAEESAEEKPFNIEETSFYQFLMHFDDPDYQRQQQERKAEKRKKKQSELANFKILYEGKRSGLCIYEDGDGHIIAADSSKFV